MKAYLLTTATVFGLIVLAHVWRITVEPHMARDPFYWLITLLSAAFCAWGLLLLRRSVPAHGA